VAENFAFFMCADFSLSTATPMATNVPNHYAMGMNTPLAVEK
jgi:hypothetical protein